jgi:hypothetical protein
VAEIHGFLARIALVLVLGTAAWAVALIATRRPMGPAIAGGLIWVVLMLVLTSLLGAVTALTVRPPRDFLHLVYGALAVSVLPIAWAVGRSRSDARRVVIVLAVACVVQLILVVRLFQTGG